jgi:hypothetical protein
MLMVLKLSVFFPRREQKATGSLKQRPGIYFIVLPLSIYHKQPLDSPVRRFLRYNYNKNNFFFPEWTTSILENLIQGMNRISVVSQSSPVVNTSVGMSVVTDPDSFFFEEMTTGGVNYVTPLTQVSPLGSAALSVLDTLLLVLLGTFFSKFQRNLSRFFLGYNRFDTLEVTVVWSSNARSPQCLVAMLVSAYNSLQWNNLSSAFLLFICS